MTERSWRPSWTSAYVSKNSATQNSSLVCKELLHSRIHLLAAQPFTNTIHSLIHPVIMSPTCPHMYSLTHPPMHPTINTFIYIVPADPQTRWFTDLLDGENPRWYCQLAGAVERGGGEEEERKKRWEREGNREGRFESIWTHVLPRQEQNIASRYSRFS